MLLIETMPTNNSIHTCSLKPQTTHKDNFTISPYKGELLNAAYKTVRSAVFWLGYI